jgi:hypothetical protein
MPSKTRTGSTSPMPSTRQMRPCEPVEAWLWS